MQFGIEAKQFNDPEEMAAAYLTEYFGNQKIEYPINPFQMLKDESILFSLMRNTIIIDSPEHNSTGGIFFVLFTEFIYLNFFAVCNSFNIVFVIENKKWYQKIKM